MVPQNDVKDDLRGMYGKGLYEPKYMNSRGVVERLAEPQTTYFSSTGDNIGTVNFVSSSYSLSDALKQ